MILLTIRSPLDLLLDTLAVRALLDSGVVPWAQLLEVVHYPGINLLN